MNYHKILKYDTANGPGIRTTIWFTGCMNNCPECFNTSIKNFNAGKLFDDAAKEELMSYLADSHVTGLSVLGGEPLIQDASLNELLKEVKEKFPEKPIWMWTGYIFKNILHDVTSNDISTEKYQSAYNKLAKISYVDYLVDGPYMKDETKYHTRFRGSSNQIIWHILPVTADGNIKPHHYYAVNESEIFDKHLENSDTANNSADTLIFSVTP